MATTGLDKIVQGSDITISMTLTNTDKTPIIIDDVVNIIVYLYQKRESILQRFSISDGNIAVTDSDAGKIAMLIDRAATENISTDRLYVEVEIVIPNTLAANNEQHIKVTNIPLADLINSVNV